MSFRSVWSRRRSGGYTSALLGDLPEIVVDSLQLHGPEYIAWKAHRSTGPRPGRPLPGLALGLLFIPLGLGGNFILLALAVVVALVTHFQAVPWWALLVMGVLVAVGEVVEALLAASSRRSTARRSRWGMLGAFVGGILGVIPGTAIAPIIGSILGSFVGSAAVHPSSSRLHRRNMKDRPSRRLGRAARQARGDIPQGFDRVPRSRPT